MQKIISAGIIIFRKTREGHKFLLLYHGRNYWNFPKGKIEAGERSWQSAVREVKEETGLKQSELRFIENFKAYERFTFRGGKEKIFKIVILYLAETKQPRITVSWEHDGYGWFTFSEAKKVLSKYHENLKILTTVDEFLRKNTKVGQKNTH
jgi:8-oxo-dGTP pyrophosphatase MutT (NUDIX family)